jgi:hypothetical protein
MNERIRSLIERAEYQVGKQYGPDWEVYVEPSREQILEKFAELIVRECQTVVEWAISVDSTIDRVPVLIKEHFGVEE